VLDWVSMVVVQNRPAQASWSCSTKRDMEPIHALRHLAPFMIADWTVDPAAMSIARDKTKVRLEYKVMQVLTVLCDSAGFVVTYMELMDRVWQGSIVSDDSLYRAIAMLRKVLGDNSRKPIYIESIPRVGYRLIAPVVRTPPVSEKSPQLTNEYFSVHIESGKTDAAKHDLSSIIMRCLSWSGGSIRAVRNSESNGSFFSYGLTMSHTIDGSQSLFNCSLYFGPRQELVATWAHREAGQQVYRLVESIAEHIADAVVREVRLHQTRCRNAGSSVASSSYWGLLLLSEQFVSMDANQLERRRIDLDHCISAYPHLAAAHAALADFESWRVANGLVTEPRATRAAAQSQCEIAVELEPDSPYVLAKCGLSLSRIGRHADGLALCTRAHELAPSLANKEILALTQCFAGECENAVQTYCGILNVLPAGHAFQYGRLAVSLVQCGRLDDASVQIERAILNFPREHFCWVLKANIDAQLDRLDSARTAWAKACALVPELTLDRVIKGIERTYGRTNEQIGHLTKGLALLGN